MTKEEFEKLIRSRPGEILTLGWIPRRQRKKSGASLVPSPLQGLPSSEKPQNLVVTKDGDLEWKSL